MRSSSEAKLKAIPEKGWMHMQDTNNWTDLVLFFFFTDVAICYRSSSNCNEDQSTLNVPERINVRRHNSNCQKYSFSSSTKVTRATRGAQLKEGMVMMRPVVWWVLVAPKSSGLQKEHDWRESCWWGLWCVMGLVAPMRPGLQEEHGWKEVRVVVCVQWRSQEFEFCRLGASM